MAREGNGYPSLCFSERENVLRCQSIFVDKPHFTNDELTFLGLGHINEFLSGIYLFVYGFARFFIEFFREPDVQLGFVFQNFSMGQVLCFFMMIAGVIVFFRAKFYSDLSLLVKIRY